MDSVTILQSAPNILLTKVFSPTGVTPYHKAATFNFEEVEVDGIEDLHKLIVELQQEKNKAVIRGIPVDGLDQGCARNGENFNDVPHHWMMIDVDGFRSKFYDDVTVSAQDMINEFVTTQLPDDFHMASYSWQLSSSAGVSDKETLKAHIWFWLEKPYTSFELRSWVKDYGIAIDPNVFQQVQIHYTAAPVFVDMESPVAERYGFYKGDFDDVQLDIETKDYVQHDVSNIQDPREKPGIIGKFNKAVDVDALLELLNHQFVITSDVEDGKNLRMTWLKSDSQSPDGAYITPDRLHLFNTHASAPCGNQLLNFYDAVRVYNYGQYDVADSNDIEQSLLARDFANLPSQKFMREFAENYLQENSAKVIESSVKYEAEKKVDVVSVLGDYEQLIENAEGPEQLHGVLASFAKDKIDNDVIVGAFAKQISKKLGVSTTEVKKQIRKERMLAAGNPDYKVRGIDGAPIMSIDNIAKMFEHRGWTCKYNVISKDLDMTVLDYEASVDNKGEAALAVIQSAANEIGFVGNGLERMVLALGDRNRVNPVREWVMSKPWDGVSRIQTVIDAIKTDRKAISDADKALLIRKWLLQVVTLGTANDEEIDKHSAAGVLVIQGDQGIGKSRFLSSLFPKRFVLSGRSVDPANKDSVLTAISYWVCELGELDATFKRSDLAALKAFLTNSNDRIRRPYAKEDSKYPRRTSFYATVNTSNFLHDTTGNRRYYTIPALSIDVNHGVDKQQLCRELYELSQTENYWLEGDDLKALTNHNQKHQSRSVLVEEMLPKIMAARNANSPFGEVTLNLVRYVGEYSQIKSRHTKSEYIDLEASLETSGVEYIIDDLGIKSYKLPILADTSAFTNVPDIAPKEEADLSEFEL